MKNRDRYIRLRLTLSLMVAMAFVSALCVRCATIGSPEGGPIDSLPPVIVSMSPNNFTTNMDTLTRKIYIEFDEFVKLEDQQTEFYTSPQMKNKPQIQLKGRGVVVTLRDTLRDNTTYALNFGSSIRDNNEGNPLYSMRYVFSTGDEIDSMIMSGYAEDSYKADSVSGTFIMFYEKDSVQLTAEYDSTLFNSTPSVTARAENNGIFLAQNLKPIPYHIYALEDTNGNLTYEPGVDRVGFLDGTYNPAQMNEFAIWYDSIRQYVVAEPQIHFRMFMDKPFKRQLLAESSRPLQHKAVLNFGANYPQIDSLIFDSIPADRIMFEYPTIGRDTINLWFDMAAEALPDTIKGRIVYQKHDSLNQLMPASDELRLAWKFFETKEQQQAREKLERERKRAEEKGEEWKEPEVPNPFKLTMIDGEVNPEKSIQIDFEYPLNRLDTTAIRFTRITAEEQKMLDEQRELEGADSLKSDKEELQYLGEAYPYKIVRDTQNIRRWHFETKWGESGDTYYLTLPEGALGDIAGFSNDSVTKRFTPLKGEEFSKIIVDVAESEITPSHYVLELLDGSGKSVKERIVGAKSGKYYFNYIPAGSYSLRVVQDLNNNGKWDSGDLIHRKQSELSKSYMSENGEREIETKVNWEIELAIDPAEMFASESQAELTARLAKEESARLEEIEHEKLESQHNHNTH